MLGFLNENSRENMLALCNVIHEGNLDALNQLLERKEVRDDITINLDMVFHFVTFSCSNLAVFNRLLKFKILRKMIADPKHSAIAFVAMHGHLDILERLLEFPTIRVGLAYYDNQALSLAAQHGHLAIVKRFLKFKSVRDKVTDANNSALSGASMCGHIEIVNCLLKIPAVQTHFILDAMNGNNIFCWSARNGHLAIVNRLLEFPAVVNNITADDNAALRWAYLKGYHAVVNRLMQFPAVRAAVLAADNADENLRALAQNTENSMRALNLQEQGIVNALQKLYPDLDSKNISAIEKELKSLRNYLEKGCKAKRLHLIFSRRNFQYQVDGIYHQAWRYLFARPNSWMSPEANFVEVTEQGRQSSIAEKDWHLLALIWRALTDKNIKLNADNLALIENAQLTKEGLASLELIRRNLIESFISTLALLARAHNYGDNQKDNGKLDEPSCSMGVTQRLLTGLIGLEIAEKPDTRPIGADYLAARFKEQLITHEAKGLLPKLKNLSHAALKQLNELLDKFIMENDGSVLDELVSILAFESQEVDAFIEEAKNYYGELRFLALHNLSYQGTVYQNAENLMRGLAAHPHIAFANEVFQFVEQELALKEKQQNEADTDAVMLKTNVLQFSETESSNARNPDKASKKRKREEAFDEDRQEEENPKKRRRIG
ncbi:ankyrin repeat domain-containing protein [Candidatus Berkiella cookevillensis]|uniref:Ankyrin repeat domain-containing protein n=1 Tax=Candidatus Berkiella cookevillensis TaxID=437022 RepID=A0A0Q9YTD3_9GAMM|nr:ankyrin repeat domain-containing protein [Candidatus Berkiella cookevillensis]MCS5708508.1 ankyrin repeat domain-containing protein [Candidatus Berkiella cookevillensis]